MNTIPSPGQGVTEEELKALEAMDPTGTSWSAAPSQPTLIKMVGKFDRIVDCAIAYSESDPNFGEKIAAHVITTHNVLPRLIVAARKGLEAEAELEEISRALDEAGIREKDPDTEEGDGEWHTRAERIISLAYMRDCIEYDADAIALHAENERLVIRQHEETEELQGIWAEQMRAMESERDTAVAALAVATEQLRWRYQVEPWLKPEEVAELPDMLDCGDTWYSQSVDIYVTFGGSTLYRGQGHCFSVDGKHPVHWNGRRDDLPRDDWGAFRGGRVIAWRPRPSVPSDVGGRKVVK